MWIFFDIAESNVSDKVNKSKICKDCVDEKIDQADTSYEGIWKGKNFQASATQVDNVNCFEIAELNVLDKVDKSNTSKDCLGEDIYYFDTMCITVSTNLQWNMKKLTKSIIFSLYWWWRDVALTNFNNIVWE